MSILDLFLIILKWNYYSNNLIVFQIKYYSGIDDKFYYTALHNAVLNDNIEIIKLLLKIPDIDVNIQSIYNDFYILI